MGLGMSRMLVCGSRNWLKRLGPDGLIDVDERNRVRAMSFRLLDYLAQQLDVDVVIEGCAPGADTLAEQWSEGQERVREHIHFPADWDREGKAAGPIRNNKMLKEGRPDFVVAFTDDIETSRGTRHMATIAEKAGIPVYVFTTEMLESLR